MDSKRLNNTEIENNNHNFVKVTYNHNINRNYYYNNNNQNNQTNQDIISHNSHDFDHERHKYTNS